MSLRVLVFVLVAFVALGASAATAAVTLRQTGNQVREAVSASQGTTDLLRDRLHDHAWRNGTGEGVSETVWALRERTGQRTRLVDEQFGSVLVDTDHFDGRASRPPGSVTVYLDPARR